MKTTLVLVATAAVASAQVTFDPATGKYKCPKPNVAYCAGDSLNTDIIIRCDADGVGQPGRCTDNLAGQPPVGVQPALCYQTSPLEGDAACEKNCIVYAKRSFTLPSSICTPWYTATSSYPSTSPPTYSPTTPPTSYPTSTSTYVPSSPPTYTASPPPTKSTSYPTSKPTTTITYSPTTPPTGKPTVTYPPHGNGTTFTFTNTKSQTDYPHPTYTPTYTPPPVVTAGAAVAQVGAGALAVVGLAAAYFL